MKTCKLTLVFCFISLIGMGQDMKVKSIEATKTNFLGSALSQVVEEFNPEGDLILKFFYDNNKQIENYRSFEYDEDYNVINEKGYAKDDVLQEEWTYFYDDKGSITKQERFYPVSNRKHTEHFILEYNESNQLIKRTDFDKDSITTWQHEYVYNRKNELVKERSEYRDSVVTETTYKFKNGHMVEMILFDFDNDEGEAQENTQTYFDRDKSGKLVKKTVHTLAEIGSAPIVTEEEFSYNKHGLVASIKRSNNGRFYSETVYKYQFF